MGDGVVCSSGEVYLRVDYTMTYDNATNQTLAALNIYGYDNYSTIKDRIYTLIPKESQYLNEKVFA